MKHINLSDMPTTELFKAYLNDATSVFPQSMPSFSADVVPSVVSGQQIGLLGGPLYTLLKIRSARAEADAVSAQLQRTVRAVFWLEDNDHDAAEASSVTIPATNGGTETITIWNGEDARLPVSKRMFSADEASSIHAIIERLDGRYANEVATLLRRSYTAQRSWSDAFLDLLQPFLEEWNITVVKGSDVTASGSHTWLVERDLEENGELERIIGASTQRLLAQGFHAQASVPDFLFFYHDEHGRHKVVREGARYRINDTLKEKSELLETLHRTPHNFSPSVLARPLVQDRYANNVVSILGAAEIAYHAQLTDLYQHLGVQQPLCVNRHMATLLDARTERLLEKSGKSVEWFFRHLEAVEHDAVSTFAMELAVPTSEAFNIESAIAPFREAAERIDPTLVKTAEAAGASVRATIEALEGKLRAAVKRTGNQALERLKSIWWMVYPDAVHSERVYPLALWMTRIGTDALRIIVEQICTQQRNTLTILGPTDVETKENHAE